MGLDLGLGEGDMGGWVRKGVWEVRIYYFFIVIWRIIRGAAGREFGSCVSYMRAFCRNCRTCWRWQGAFSLLTLGKRAPLCVYQLFCFACSNVYFVSLVLIDSAMCERYGRLLPAFLNKWCPKFEIRLTFTSTISPEYPSEHFQITKRTDRTV